MRRLKENRIVSASAGQMTMAEYVAYRIREVMPPFLAQFLGEDATLVPVPRSSLQKAHAIWPAMEIAAALRSRGFGGQVSTCLSRARAVPKAATAPAQGRPRAAAHLESLQVSSAVDLPPVVVLVDDVITRGAQVMGAAWALWKVRPDLEIRAFAVIRTTSDEGAFTDVIDPVIGTITVRGAETFRAP